MAKSATPNFLIYGANGYTGRLITEMAIARGLKPVLGGRNAKAIKKMAKKYNLDYEICDLNHPELLNDMVLGVDVVLHCAGPFSRTAKPMIKACLKNKTHYLDITGEIEIFEMMAGLDDMAKEAEIMVMPGVGFDVVPSDCLAAYLKAQMPDATHLTLAFMSVGGGLSHGTATTMLENLGTGGAVRENGIIKQVKQAHKVRQIPYRRKKKPVLSATIPWGDVSTAFYSTGIPNIEVFTAVNKIMLWFMQSAESMGWLLKRNFIKNFLQGRIDNREAGPSAKERKKGRSYLWGEVKNQNGNTATARLTTPEGYTLTAMTALAAVEKVLKGNAPTGFQTPSTAYGYNFIMEIEGVVREDSPREIRVT